MPNMGGVLKVRLPLELLAALDEVAASAGVGRSLWVRRALMLALGSDKAVEVGRAMVENAAEVPVVADWPAETIKVREPVVHVRQTPADDKLARMYRNQGRQI